uniref:Shell matrix protein n=1 Tax=Laqueus rubellus TaxID=93892 RepID=A0A3G9CNJ3_LAQRU
MKKTTYNHVINGNVTVMEDRFEVDACSLILEEGSITADMRAGIVSCNEIKDSLMTATEALTRSNCKKCSRLPTFCGSDLAFYGIIESIVTITDPNPLRMGKDILIVQVTRSMDLNGNMASVMETIPSMLQNGQVGLWSETNKTDPCSGVYPTLGIELLFTIKTNTMVHNINNATIEEKRLEFDTCTLTFNEELPGTRPAIRELILHHEPAVRCTELLTDPEALWF